MLSVSVMVYACVQERERALSRRAREGKRREHERKSGGSKREREIEYVCERGACVDVLVPYDVIMCSVCGVYACTNLPMHCREM